MQDDDPEQLGESSEEAFTALFQTFQLDETALATRADQTLAPDRKAASRSLLSLPLVRTDESSSDDAAELLLGDILGQGGMGLVREARQNPIGRNVAVKTVRRDRRTEQTAHVVLLQEAIVTGRLEHPNIVPIYTVGQGHDGGPVVVMKRIEGREWSHYLTDPSSAPGYAGEPPLEWHLGVLIDVCQAVHYAHDRGIVHRDIKPDNVMIGEFGEVYLFDWGIAVTLDDDDDAQIPRAADVRRPAGTPAFMAPEMAAGRGTEIDGRTDVYLLGAVLYQLMTGRTPHEGATLFAIMLHAYRGAAFDFPPELPSELVEICRVACAPRPEDRYPSAAALRDALRGYLEHRSAVELEERARARLEQLEAAVASAGDPEGDDDVAVHRLFGECHFGFERALEIWPDSDAAREGIERATVAMFEFELHQASPHAAAMLLRELRAPRPELEARLQALREDLAAAEARGEELERFRRDLDMTSGAGVRGPLLVVIVFLLLGLPAFLLDGGFDEINRQRHLLFGRIAAGLVTTLAVLVRWVWLRHGANQVDHRLGGTLVFAVFFVLFFRETGALLGTPVEDLLVLELVAFSMAWGYVGAGFDWRLAWMAPVYLGAAGAVVLGGLPHVSVYISTHAVALLYAAAIWFRLAAPDSGATEA